jgi:hypothetical protein
MSEFEQEKLKEILGEKVYSIIEKEAENEVSLSLKMDLVNKYKEKQWYRHRWLIEEFSGECAFFVEKKLTISPLEIVNVLFLSKLLFACKTEDEFLQRSGGGMSFDPTYIFSWSERSFDIIDVINNHLKKLVESSIKHTLITEISLFQTHDFGLPGEYSTATDFFDSLFNKLDLPFEIFLNDAKLLDKYKDKRPGRKTYDEIEAKRFFCCPSIGFTTTGSPGFIYIYCSAWLRVFLNLLRISGFINNGQIDFGFSDIEMMAPTSPVILGTNSMGTLSWNEDTKRPWTKMPDGCLFRSFGYRGLSKMYLDSRTFKGIETFFLDNKIIFEYLKNPWNTRNINDIEPTLDILSSVTQIPDLGAKILLIYCCLEHLFVPKNIIHDNKKYIIGGINAIKQELLPWFERLYKIRCDYAHKGYIISDDSIRSLIFESIGNIILLLTLKLKQ